jgi:hypothetical protein
VLLISCTNEHNQNKFCNIFISISICFKIQ